MSESPFTFPVIHNAVGIMTPFLLAAIGGLMTELAGMLNIALEGLILMGAFACVAAAGLTGSLFLGLVIGISVTLLLALLFGVITLYLRANVFITGLATNLLAGGLITVTAFAVFGNKGVILFPRLPDIPRLSLPGLEGIPLLGDLLMGHTPFTYLSWLLVLLAAVLLYRTPFGFHLRGAGVNPRALQSLGLHPRRYQLAGILLSGLTCGLAGAVLTLELGAYVPNISAGRGWIALVVIYLGGRTPQGILAASFIFALAESFSNYAQGFINVPADFILAFPYFLTVLAMVIYSIIQYRRREAPFRS